jgi:peptidylprolyl isomerase domain and WD repeat-containing protein 1
MVKGRGVADDPDMINIFKFTFKPNAVAWVHTPGAGQLLLAVSDVDSPTIRIYDGRGDGTPMHELTKIHRAPVHLMAVSGTVGGERGVVADEQYNSKYDCVVSADEDGFVEYWQPSEPWGVPSISGIWQYKSQTDLFQFKKVSLPSPFRNPSRKASELADEINSDVDHFQPILHPFRRARAAVSCGARV